MCQKRATLLPCSPLMQAPSNGTQPPHLVATVPKRHISGVHAAVPTATATRSAQRQVRRRKGQHGGCWRVAPLG